MTQPTEYFQTTDNNPSGSQTGKSTTEKHAFFGATPVVQQSVTQQTTATTTALRADLDSVMTALSNLGLVTLT
jgi:hypothetical protein